MIGRLRKHIFGISLAETTVAKRGFDVSDEAVCQHLEKIGRTFVHGYHAALLDTNPQTLGTTLNTEIEHEYTGFAFEGAGMGLAILDMLTPWGGNRIERFLDGPGDKHAYMVHVGVGWALSRIPRSIERYIEDLDPIMRWLVPEGYGFHEAYFHPRRTVEEQIRPRRLQGYACQAFDQGVGRCLWFVKGSDVARITTTVAAFSSERRASLWSGVGLAAGYAGGVDAAALRALNSAADAHYPALAQGVAFAAITRQYAQNLVAHNATACQVVCGLPLNEVVQICDAAEPSTDAAGAEPIYEIWRQNIQAQFKKPQFEEQQFTQKESRQ